ncbi:hypothetical protein DB30_04122 [Enhygromyxa salina]|uniref:Uncharacterized protein n=2 Tax=Enhygromyxa salina TaxID=215803 RepID=A0A0C2A079_9BACT|nr:hypothetical protein DB30_04122 [Enhygromyxa salina]
MLPLLGCGPGSIGDGGTFRITAVDFDGDATLTLTFSHPVANVDAIDPNDFRISVAQTYSITYTDPDYGTYTYAGTFYSDLGAFGYNYQYEYTRFEIVSATLGADNQIRLEGQFAFGDDVCEQLAYAQQQFEMYLAQYPGSKVEIGMFLHYAAGDIPVLSERDETIANIGAQWVLTESLYMQNDVYGFPNLQPRLEIPCP